MGGMFGLHQESGAMAEAPMWADEGRHSTVAHPHLLRGLSSGEQFGFLYCHDTDVVQFHQVLDRGDAACTLVCGQVPYIPCTDVQLATLAQGCVRSRAVGQRLRWRW